jgi:predicted secreted Zn-dependent protease
VRIILALVCVIAVSLTEQGQSGSLNHSALRAPIRRIAFPKRVQVSFYPVEGKTAAQLRASMMERGPIGHENIRFYAYTLWHMKIAEAKIAGVENSAKHRELSCYISMFLPFLRPDSSRSIESELQWTHFMSSIVAHESRHVRNVVRACRQLSRVQLKDSFLLAISRRLKKRDQEYDARTQHGKLEGVKLST